MTWIGPKDRSMLTDDEIAWGLRLSDMLRARAARLAREELGRPVEGQTRRPVPPLGPSSAPRPAARPPSGRAAV